MIQTRPLLAWMIRAGTSALCRIDTGPLTDVPSGGPLILAMNHINSLEVPLLSAHLQPRKMTGVAKVETWDNPLMGWLFDQWEAIPIQRGEPDVVAVKRALAVLAGGGILAVAPEGTRSYTGRLLRARPGIVTLALHSGAPILPVVHWGGEKFSGNLRRLKRTDFHIRVGKPFRLAAGGIRLTHEVRQAMVDEIMVQLAGLMPEFYRGEYAAFPATQQYLQFA
jgi:1-acyl-sn-glycerol-3-phosphate acyltransferase